MTLMLAAAAAVSLLVGGVGIMNVMLVSVSERRQEIGLRMAIGAHRSEIGLQFLIEAGLLALLGCGAGVVLALGVAVACRRRTGDPESGDRHRHPRRDRGSHAHHLGLRVFTHRGRLRVWTRPTRWPKMRSLTHRIDPSV